MRTGQARYAIVAGVDSFPHPRMLKHCIDQRRLMNSGNSNRFFPSEAGCAVLLAADDGQRPGRGDARHRLRDQAH
ncbi:hypothetical protein CBA19CS22_06495 [Caballeronia novacaledonica]|uniref:Uncharacterized protein n=1 Tax=Caballeronia novacaledonica TaxID=1544861 RepID=A0ACB5QMX1_9BURK|nr:hypothetical protein CBA19CS22_06495 [Caballeronia novacaledonica]